MLAVGILTSSQPFLAERISYVMFKFYYETGVYIMEHHIIIFTVNDPFNKCTHFCEGQGPLSKSFNVKMSSNTQQGVYKNSAIHTYQEHWQNRTKLF